MSSSTIKLKMETTNVLHDQRAKIKFEACKMLLSQRKNPTLRRASAGPLTKLCTSSEKMNSTQNSKAYT